MNKDFDDDNEKESNKKHYLYLDDDALPVVEYVETDTNKESMVLNKHEVISNSKENAMALKADKSEKGDNHANRISLTKPHYIKLSKDYNITIVIFYQPWCPHCQVFKPYFIKVAEDVTNRVINEKISFRAISCLVNYDICTTYKVKDFPSVYGFRDDPTKLKLLNGDSDPPFSSDSIRLFLGMCAWFLMKRLQCPRST